MVSVCAQGSNKKQSIQGGRQRLWHFNSSAPPGDNGAARPSCRYGAHRSDSGSSRRSAAEARAEAGVEEGSLVAVCGQHYHDLVYLCCHHLNHEHGEKHPGAKIKTQWQLTTDQRPGLDLDWTSALGLDWTSSIWHQYKGQAELQNRHALPQFNCVTSTHLSVMLQRSRNKPTRLSFTKIVWFTSECCMWNRSPDHEWTMMNGHEDSVCSADMWPHGGELGQLLHWDDFQQQILVSLEVGHVGWSAANYWTRTEPELTWLNTTT